MEQDLRDQSHLGIFTKYWNWVPVVYALTVLLFRFTTRDADPKQFRMYKHLFAAGGLLNMTYIFSENAGGMYGFEDLLNGIMATVGLICIISTYFVHIRGKQPRDVDMTGKVVIITGCNTGIGLAAAEKLVSQGAHVIFACRSEEKAVAAIAEITADLERIHSAVKTDTRPAVKGKMQFIQLDLMSLASVKKFNEEFAATKLGLDVLVLNAGVMLDKRQTTEDGHEATLGVNHIGHFLLTNLLMPMLDKSQDGRVVVVTSGLHLSVKKFDFDDPMTEKKYSMWRAYGKSKLAGVMFAMELQRRCLQRKSAVIVNSVAPGNVMTDISRNMHPILAMGHKAFAPILALYCKQPGAGANTVVYAATSKVLREPQPVYAQYFVNCFPEDYNSAASDLDACSKLWTLSEAWAGLSNSKKKK